MKKNEKIKTPTSQFIKELKDYNNNTYYSFLHNKSEKNKETNEWVIKERYVINVMNITVKPNTEIEINEILETVPRVMKDKKGKDYMNCILYVTASVVGEKEENFKKQANNTFDDFPF